VSCACAYAGSASPTTINANAAERLRQFID
jgi:hypothetical protein